jgi:hypothetical protein
VAERINPFASEKVAEFHVRTDAEVSSVGVLDRPDVGITSLLTELTVKVP